MQFQTWIPLTISLLYSAFGLNPVPLGFPSIWNGDHYKQADAKIIQKPPSWVDGFLFAQTGASYGDQSSPKGQKLMHMFDAMSGVSVFELSPNKATFTGSYYPNRQYKIWEFNDRDFENSKISWHTAFSDINATTFNAWKHIQTDPGCDVNPNVDFWKVGNKIVSATEAINPIGMSFDLPTIDNFKPFWLTETDDRIIKKTLIGIHMPIHEHVDHKAGLLWNVAVALNLANNPPTFHEIIFSVDENGTRTVQGMYDFSPIDYSKCSKSDSKYGGPVSGNGIVYPRYMHTITATQNYIILPMGSVTVRTCQLVFPRPFNPDNQTVFNPTKDFIFDYDPSAPVVFLFFDKKTKKFLDPIEYKTPLFLTHQFNAYETSDGKVFVDMLAYDHNIYDALTTNNLLTPGDHNEFNTQVTRFTIDLKAQTISTSFIVPFNDQSKFEFSQINHRFGGKKYKYGYALNFPLFNGNQIVKIDMDTPDGSKNKIFKAGDTISMAEPSFAARPGGTEEDDGVIVVRGLDTSVNKTRVFILDAKTMQKVGEVLSPTYTPFGFHERYYSKEQLGMSSGAARPSRHWF